MTGELVSEAAKGNGIAQVLDGWDAVFPVGSHFAAEEVGGAGGEELGVTLPAVRCFASESKRAGRRQRDADDVVENRFVAMPADGRSGTVLGDKDVWKIIGFQT